MEKKKLSLKFFCRHIEIIARGYFRRDDMVELLETNFAVPSFDN